MIDRGEGDGDRFAAFIGDGEVERWEGVVLLVGLLIALFLVIRGGSGLDDLADPEELDQTPGQLAITTMLGLVMTVVGAQVVVWSSTEIADEHEISCTKPDRSTTLPTMIFSAPSLKLTTQPDT